jgi:flavin-dependent dehydrogenase
MEQPMPRQPTHPIITPARTEHVDVVVVGARCAGASTAMLLASAGHDVLVVDRAEFPSDTLSTHALARGAMVQLHRWGVLPAVVDSGAALIRQVVLHVGDTSIDRTIKDRHGVDFLVAPRRHIFDPVLQDAARAAGARIRTGVTVTGVLRNDQGRVVGVSGRDVHGPIEITARFVVGADGLKSRVARSVAAPITEHRNSSAAAHYAYFAGDWPAMEYYLGERFAGIFPTHGGEACIWVCAPDDWSLEQRRRHPTLQDAFMAMVAETAPDLAERLRDAVQTSAPRGMMSLPNQIRHPVGDGWALVGDAGYHRDAVTGHGITDALRDAELLAHALDRSLRDEADERVALAAYHAERDRMLREIFEITCEMSAYPSGPRFIELQKGLGGAIERHAAELAARPLPRVLAGSN